MKNSVNKNYLKKYLTKLNECLITLEEEKFLKISNLVKDLKKSNKIIFIGNGGSASIASHCATDFSKFLKIRSMTFNDILTIIKKIIIIIFLVYQIKKIFTVNKC